MAITAMRDNGATTINEVTEKMGGSGVEFPPTDKRPCFGVYEKATKNGKDAKPGVYWHYATEGKDPVPIDTWICDPLHIAAKTRDESSSAWGRLLKWKDADGRPHQWAMPMELLEGDGADVRRELAHHGLRIAPGRKPRELLESYIKNQDVKDSALCVSRLGWHGGVYVTPGEVIGQSDDVVVFQNCSAAESAFAASGTEGQWRSTVGALSAGNTRLVFAISAAFAAPLAELAGEDSGGFHLRGASSSGKSTVLKVAASVWGGPAQYVRLWRATANGLEGVAALHNDGLLILDELSQIDAKEAGQCAYMLANGQGKARASRTGAARQPARWRLLFLSAGETSLAALMAAEGRRANAGQEIRLADIESDAGCGLGIFDTLHHHGSGASLATALKDSASSYFGAVGRTWLRQVVNDRASVIETMNAGMREFMAAVVPDGAAGQVERVARRFALVAVAGELATHYKLTGWKKGEANAAAQACFRSWLEGFGGAGNAEERAIIRELKDFIDRHGDSRFSDASGNSEISHDRPVINRAGYYRQEAGGRIYLFTSGGLRDATAGHDFKRVITVLNDAGAILKKEEKKGEKRYTFPAWTPEGTKRLYWIDPQKLAPEDVTRAD